MDENPSEPGDLSKPRDTMSRAARMAERIQGFLFLDRQLWSSGRCMGLRAYGLQLAGSVMSLVKLSETADSAEFDTYREIVSFLADELEAVMYEILEA